jgi:hypothetical protein
VTGTPEKGQTAAKAWWKRFVSDPANMWANLSDADRNGWAAVEQAVAGPLEAENERLSARLGAADAFVRDVLEALCRRDGLPLESAVTPGEPARNYELADRLGIGGVFGLKPQADERQS